MRLCKNKALRSEVETGWGWKVNTWDSELGVAGVSGIASVRVSEEEFEGTRLESNMNDVEVPNGVAGGVRSSMFGLTSDVLEKLNVSFFSRFKVKASFEF